MTPIEPSADSTSARRPTRSATQLLVCLFVAALALRPQLIGIGPLLPRIQADLDASFAWSGLLTTIPLLCMGVFAPLAPAIVRRVGTDRGLVLALAGLGGFGLWRAAAASPTSLLITTTVVGVSIAVAGTLLPMIVKESLPHRPAAATGIYVAGIQLGAAGSALVAVPIASSAGGWRTSLLVFSAFAIGSALVWLLLRGLRQTVLRQVSGVRWAIIRSGRAWVLAGIFGLQSILFYGLVTWMPAYFVETGRTETTAGALLAALNTAGLVTSLTVARYADRRGSRRAYLLAGSALTATMIVAMLAVPALGLLWASAAGVGLALLFTISLTLPLDLAADSAEAGASSAFVLGIGFMISAVAPSALGAIRDAAATFSMALLALIPVAALLMVGGAWLSPARLAPRSTSAGH